MTPSIHRTTTETKSCWCGSPRERLPVCATIDGVEIGLVELECVRDGVGKLRTGCRLVALDFLGLARVLVEGTCDRKPTEILVVVEDLDASLSESVELGREITFPLARVVRVACEELWIEFVEEAVERTDNPELMENPGLSKAEFAEKIRTLE